MVITDQGYNDSGCYPLLMNRHITFTSILFAVCLTACSGSGRQHFNARPSPVVEAPTASEIGSPSIRAIVTSANEQIGVTTGYTQAYFNIPYPNGDLPESTGACTDVVIRAFRSAGVDLQKEVHEDIAANFNVYPKKWGLAKPDTNIDHRRVPNLQVFFARKGKSLPVSDDDSSNFQPGDVVTWDLNGKGMTHIGLVSNLRNIRSGRYLVVHNIGGGTKAENRLFDWKITGHYRYF